MYGRVRVIFFGASLFVFSSYSVAQNTDCIIDAAECFQINPLIVKAIIWQESKNNQNVINKNKNNTTDVGLMQVNSIHFPSLEALGVNTKLLIENSCANVFSGVWILNQAIHHYGYTWDGIGYYHSSTVFFHDRYIENIISIITKQSVILNKIQVSRLDGIKEKFHCG